jgi:ABC-2 type transport system ATP-binding protein
MSKNIVETQNLTKTYPGNIEAVDNISFSVQKGEIFGFLGPNGAGKTTTILMLITLLQPTSGNASVCGFDIVKNQHEVRRCLGYVSQDTAVDDDLTGWENLTLQAGFYHLSRQIATERIEEVLKMVDLKDRANEMVAHYSGGMRKRLDIASGLIHRPKILFLDEPTLGLDIQTRYKIWDYIEKLRTEKEITIFLTTHYMDEADFLCNRVAIIDQGTIKAIGIPNELKNALGGDILELKIDDAAKSQTDKVVKEISALNFVNRVRIKNESLLLYIEDGEHSTPKIFTLLDKLGVSIRTMLLKKPSLDDVFLHHTGKALRDESVNRETSIKSRIHMRRIRR